MKKEAWIEELLGKMSLEQKIGQCVVVGMSGTVITNDLREAITRYHCSGIRLSGFTRMFKYFSDDKAKRQELGADFVPSLQKLANEGLPPHCTPEQYAGMLNELRALAAARSPAIPLHMIIDQEGDTSRDFARGGVVQYPSSMGLVAGRSPERAYRVAVGVSRQMKASGLDMIHSPVVDVNINPKNPEIGHRAFSDDPDVTAEYALAMLKGFKENKVIAAAKHFPGRGDSATDAHHACPVLNVDADRFNKIELAPYRALIAAGIDAIMVAHCLYPHIDPDQISTVSRKVVTGILRDQLGFEGMITTDSITMGALIDRYGIGEACARALDAGADIILMKAENRWRGEMFYTIRKWVEAGKIKADELDDKVRRILAIKKQYGLFDKMGQVDASKASAPFKDELVVNTAREAAQHAILVAKDELKALPVDRKKRVLLINQQYSLKTPNDFYDHPAIFAQLMEQDWPSLQTY
jgi:beta-N-acetylhexosaminidase